MRAASLLVLCLGCSSPNPQPQPPAPASSADPADPASTSAPALPSSAARGPSVCTVPVHQCYGPLDTVAGRGEIRRKGQSGWRAAFEGGPARDAELSRPHFAMADRAGVIYIADKDAHAIRAVSPDGAITTVVGTGQPGDDGDGPGPERRLSSPNGLWVRGDGTVYILDLGNSKVRKLAPSGRLETLFAVPGGVALGRGLWVADDERSAFVASGDRVLAWSPDGGVTTLASGFRALGNLVGLPDGGVIAADRGAGRVVYINRAGDRVDLPARVASTTAGIDAARALDGVRAVFPHPDGGYILGTHEGDRVWHLDPAGVLHLLFAPPAVSEVRGVSVTPDGAILVVDDDRGFVKRALPRRSRPEAP